MMAGHLHDGACMVGCDFDVVQGELRDFGAALIDPGILGTLTPTTANGCGRDIVLLSPLTLQCFASWLGQ